MNYNVKFFLEQCLYSVIKAATSIQCEILVADNHSSDGSREYLQPRFPQVKFLWNEENVGFGAACNRMLDMAQGETILFLNPDTVISENALTDCIRFLRAHSDCGALGVKMIDGSGKFLKESKRSFPSPWAAFTKMTGLARLFPSSELFAGYYAPHVKTGEVKEVDVLPGAFLMMPCKVIRELRGFDTDYFMYGEDVDLSFRLQRSGRKNYYYPDVVIVHYKGESTQKLTRHHIRHFYGSMNLFVGKHYKNRRLMPLILKGAISAGRMAATFRLMFARKRCAGAAVRSGAPKVWIAGNHDQFNDAVRLLKYAVPSRIISGRIAAEDWDVANTESDFWQLNAAIAAGVDEILFCEGILSNKDIILKMQELASKVDFLYKAEGSQCIVGSNDRNKNGIVISAVPS